MLSLRPLSRLLVVAALAAGPLVACATGSSIGSAADRDAGGAAGGSGGGAGSQGAGGDASVDQGAGGATADASNDAGGAAGDAGTAGGGGGGGTAGGGGSGGTDGGQDPCVGVTCATPPPNVCADTSTLQVFSTSGTCAQGTCSYASSTTSCPNGCTAGACAGDPCIGVTCASPPASYCADTTTLAVYDTPGSCSGGTCSYATHDEYCQFGCVNGICNGDPCVGQSCATPPASYCSSASNLEVYDVPGACSGGTCSFTHHSVFCAFGCANGACANDPCAGVSCSTPPASYCSAANTLHQFAATGTCSAGACSYGATDVSCPYGCANGVCKNCSADADCGGGKWCNAGTCVACTTDAHCGASCANCAASAKVCSAGACVACTTDSQCGAGSFCSGNACAACNTDAHCGASCAACGSGTKCNGTACAACETAASCGPTCAPCGGGTPLCQPNGAQSKCVACLSDANCTGGNVCNTQTGTCVPPCPATLTSVFTDDFAAPSASGWTSGTDVAIGTSRWKAFTTAKHGLRIYNGRLDVTNVKSGSPDHGQGYAYVMSSGATSAFDPSFRSTLKANTSESVVWSFNMERDDPEVTNGGFSCSSVSSQNDITVGLAFVLATNSASGLNASAGTCSASATSHGYAVVRGGSQKVRLVRFTNGLRNGALTDLVASGNFPIANFLSVRVTYDATTDQWKLEVRNDGASSFTDPKGGGAYGFTGTATDATYVNEALDYMGPYFQTGCTGLCSSTYDALFDNVSVGVRCAP